ncbi:MAG TPA: ABC transporter permease [Polyangia bacterium]
MSFLGLLRIAIKGFSRHRMRALLTALGIMIGVGAFITMVALGRGASARVASQIAAMGSNVLIVRGGGSMFGGARGGGGTTGLNDGDLEAIKKEADAVKFAAPEVSTSAQVVWSGVNWATQVRGTTPDYVHVRAWNIQRGGFFGQRDVDTANKVCVLGQVVVDQLFGAEDPIGQTVRIRSLNCEVIGVLARKGQGGMGQDYDDVVLMPVTTVRRKLNNAGAAQAASIDRIYLSAISANDTARAQTQVQDLLRQRKRTREGDPDDPMVRDMTEFAEAAQEANKTMTLLLAGIALVSLVVGGIGIMNIMLVSVTERTREIGIRMAVGAKGRHILLQFLLESIVLSIIGGLVGVAIGTGAAKIMSAKMEWPTSLEPQSYVIAVGFSTLVGVLFGFYPAWRASRLDPIEALRYE